MNPSDQISQEKPDEAASRTERLDFIQNITIALLSVTAVLLFSRTELFALGWETAAETFQMAVRVPSSVSTEASLSAPVRLAAFTTYGRRGDLFLTTDSPAFQAARTLLAAALGNQEGTWDEISQSDFLAALDGLSLYYDFLHPLPLSVLSGFSDTHSPDNRQARFALLGLGEDGTALYLWDGQETYYRRSVSVTQEELEEAAVQYQSGSASFAMDYGGQEDGIWRALAPLSLLPGRTPSLPQLTATGGSAGTDALLTALRFNPLTNSRYPESNGTEVVVEGSRTVRIRANGSIYYQAGGAEERLVLSVESAGEVPTAWEAAAGSASILRSLLGGGGGTMYLCEARQEENRTYLRFDYQFSGVPIRFSDGRSAAEVTLEGRSVSTLELRPRQYAAAEWESLLLPLPQALGIAALRPGAELTVGYADDGSGQISAAWMEG